MNMCVVAAMMVLGHAVSASMIAKVQPVVADFGFDSGLLFHAPHGMVAIGRSEGDPDEELRIMAVRIGTGAIKSWMQADPDMVRGPIAKELAMFVGRASVAAS